MDTVSLLYRGVLYVEVILYSKECNWYTRCCLLNGGVRYRECPLRETILYCYIECSVTIYRIATVTINSNTHYNIALTFLVITVSLGTVASA